MAKALDNKALGGLKALDFSTTIAGPYCARLLADLGADVVKIESLEGDVLRARPPLRNGASSAFGQLNAGKKSVTLDLKKPAAVDAVHRLAEQADIIVENFRPGVMKRLGLDFVVTLSFLAVLVPLVRTRATLLVVAVAALATALLIGVVPSGIAVLGAGLAGCVAGALASGKEKGEGEK